MFEIKRGTEQGDPLSSLPSNTVLQMALKDDVTRWQKIKGMGICLGDSESDCLTHLRFADDVLLFSTSLVQLQKMLCDFKQSTERVGLKIHPEKTKIFSNQSSKRRKQVKINNIKVETLSLCESAKYLRTNSYVSATGNSRDQKSNQSGLGILLQIQTRADIKIVLPAAQTPTFQHGDHADAELRLWHLDTIKGTRKNDTIDSTQNAPPHRPNKKEYTKRKLRPARTSKDGEGEKDANHRSSDDETAEGSSSNTDCDQDSDVSFMKDTDEEIDTAEIEEEEWIEYTKRRTATAVERMKEA